MKAISDQNFQINNKEIDACNEAWRRHVSNQSSFQAAPEYWDKRAPKYRKKDTDEYGDKLYSLMQLRPGESIFDMGCGAGTLAISYAQKGHEIYAADFSEAMLSNMMDDAEEMQVSDAIHPLKLDWNENWNEKKLPICDIAVCSRAQMFNDLDEAIRKLEGTARRRVCLVTLDEIYEDGTSQCDIILAYLKCRGIDAECIKMCFRPGNMRRRDAYEIFIAWNKERENKGTDHGD